MSTDAKKRVQEKSDHSLYHNLLEQLLGNLEAKCDGFKRDEVVRLCKLESAPRSYDEWLEADKEVCCWGRPDV